MEENNGEGGENSREEKNSIPPLKYFLKTHVTKGGGNYKVIIIENMFALVSGQVVTTQFLLDNVDGMTPSLIWDLKQEGILKRQKVPDQKSTYPLQYRVTCNNFTTVGNPLPYQNTALLKPSKQIEHPLIFEEAVEGENDTFNFDLFHQLTMRPSVKALTEQSFQYREDSLGHISAAIDFDIERTRHDLSVFPGNIRSVPVTDWDHGMRF